MNSLVEIEENIKTDLYLVNPKISKSLHSTDNLVLTHGIESLDMIELIARIEDRYRIPIEDSDWKKLQSITQLAGYIFNKINPTNGN